MVLCPYARRRQMRKESGMPYDPVSHQEERRGNSDSSCYKSSDLRPMKQPLSEPEPESELESELELGQVPESE
jgi:hypothetical protein